MAGLEAVLVRAATLAPAEAAERLHTAAAEGAAQLAKQAVERIARLREARTQQQCIWLCVTAGMPVLRAPRCWPRRRSSASWGCERSFSPRHQPGTCCLYASTGASYRLLALSTLRSLLLYDSRRGESENTCIHHLHWACSTSRYGARASQLLRTSTLGHVNCGTDISAKLGCAELTSSTHAQNCSVGGRRRRAAICKCSCVRACACRRGGRWRLLWAPPAPRPRASTSWCAQGVSV